MKFTMVVVAFDWIRGDLFVRTEFISVLVKIYNVTDMKNPTVEIVFSLCKPHFKAYSYFDIPFSQILNTAMSLSDLRADLPIIYFNLPKCLLNVQCSLVNAQLNCYHFD